MRLRTVVWTLAIGGTISALACLGTHAVRRLNEGIASGLASHFTAKIVIQYMEAHRGVWPRAWEDLKPHFDQNYREGYGMTFASCRPRVRIDFNVDSEDLRRRSLATPWEPFDVIPATFVFGFQIDDDPNLVLRDYFRQKAGKTD